MICVCVHSIHDVCLLTKEGGHWLPTFQPGYGRIMHYSSLVNNNSSSKRYVRYGCQIEYVPTTLYTSIDPQPPASGKKRQGFKQLYAVPIICVVNINICFCNVANVRCGHCCKCSGSKSIKQFTLSCGHHPQIKLRSY